MHKKDFFDDNVVEQDIIAVLKALSDQNRLRILNLCSNFEITVRDIVAILGLSQPLVSKHIRNLLQAELLVRYSEGANTYYRFNKLGSASHLAVSTLEIFLKTRSEAVKDIESLELFRKEKSKELKAYFDSVASNWDREREKLFTASIIEKELINLAKQLQVGSLLDVGTGTGIMLEVLKDYYHCAVGIDTSKEMLKLARSRMVSAKNDCVRVHLCDMHELPEGDEIFDLVIFSMSLHCSERPLIALKESCRVLRPNGKLVIVDFCIKENQLPLLESDENMNKTNYNFFTDNDIAKWFNDLSLLNQNSKLITNKLYSIKMWTGNKRNGSD